MTVHLFGAGSSPGCRNFAMKTADDHEQEFGFEPTKFLRKDFYVNDGLKSVPSTSDSRLKRCVGTEDLISINLQATREKSLRPYQWKIERKTKRS